MSVPAVAPALRNGKHTEAAFRTATVTAAGPCPTEVRLSPAGTFVANGGMEAEERSERRRQLAVAIRQRIETRLGGRVRELTVRIVGNTVVLEGRCATYYTKQLAQHAALGVLNDEKLENAIEVGVPQ